MPERNHPDISLRFSLRSVCHPLRSVKVAPLANVTRRKVYIMKKFVAITNEGSEYMYRTRSAHNVPIAKARAICDLLNRARYELRPGEVWHVYNDESNDPFAAQQRFTFRSGRLVRLGY